MCFQAALNDLEVEYGRDCCHTLLKATNPSDWV